jgi:predicted DsbA family dithiol-disulfide isomerase
MSIIDCLDSIAVGLERSYPVNEQKLQTLQQQVANNKEQLRRLEQATEPLKLTAEAPEGSEAQSQALQAIEEASLQLARANTQLAQINSQQVGSVDFSDFLLELTQRASQASEAAQMLAQSNQVAIRDLIEELKQGRGA